MIRGLKTNRSVDAIFINTPLKDYDVQPRLNDFTLPVLGLGYIATAAAVQGFNVGVLDAEAEGMGISEVCRIVNAKRPRWVGLNLLAPTYRLSGAILHGLDPDIKVMLGGHQAKAMPREILLENRIGRIDSLVVGEGDSRCAALLEDVERRTSLPGIWYRERGKTRLSEPVRYDDTKRWTAPDVNQLALVDREFFSRDPFLNDQSRIEANMVGSRGCSYNC